jgi:hypothetical protein
MHESVNMTLWEAFMCWLIINEIYVLVVMQ